MLIQIMDIYAFILGKCITYSIILLRISRLDKTNIDNRDKNMGILWDLQIYHKGSGRTFWNDRHVLYLNSSVGYEFIQLSNHNSSFHFVSSFCCMYLQNTMYILLSILQLCPD